MQAALDAILRRLITVGRLTVRWPDGRLTTYAGPAGSGPEATITICDQRSVRRLVLNPELMLGETYMDGGLVPDANGIYNTLDLLVANVMTNANGHPVARLRAILGQLKRRIDQYNPAP